MSKTRREQFEHQLRDLQRDISLLSQKITTQPSYPVGKNVVLRLSTVYISLMAVSAFFIDGTAKVLLVNQSNIVSTCRFLFADLVHASVSQSLQYVATIIVINKRRWICGQEQQQRYGAAYTRTDVRPASRQQGARRTGLSFRIGAAHCILSSSASYCLHYLDN